MTNRGKGNILVYLNVILLIFLSGSIYGISLYYKQTVYIVLGFTVIVSLIKGRLVLNKNACLLFAVFLFLVILVPIINKVAISSYLAILLQMLTVLLFSSTHSFRSFESVFVKIMLILATISLFFYFTFLVFPGIALLFPKTVGNASLDYYNAGVYVFGAAKGYGGFVPFYRNMGIFWEPGCYQSFLNLALFFFLNSMDINDNLKKKYYIFGITIFCITIITTYSTTGIIVLSIILLRFSRKIRKTIDSRTAILVLALVVVTIIIGLKLFQASFLIEKLKREFSVGGTALNRLALSSFKLLFQEPSSVIGISFEQYARLTNNVSGNSYIQALISLGFPFTIILTLMYIHFSKKYTNGWTLFAIMIMFFFTESLFWRPIYLCLAWYSIAGDRQNDKSYYSFS